jgi:hypothetical protein
MPLPVYLWDNTDRLSSTAMDSDLDTPLGNLFSNKRKGDPWVDPSPAGKTLDMLHPFRPDGWCQDPNGDSYIDLKTGDSVWDRDCVRYPKRAYCWNCTSCFDYTGRNESEYCSADDDRGNPAHVWFTNDHGARGNHKAHLDQQTWRGSQTGLQVHWDDLPDAAWLISWWTDAETPNNNGSTIRKCIPGSPSRNCSL